MTTKYEYYVPTYPYTVGWGFSDTYWLAQGFTPQISHTICEVYLSLYNVSGTVVVEIRTVSQVNGDPTGGIILDSGIGWNPCILSGTLKLVAGTRYAIVFHMQNTGEAGRVYAGCLPNYPLGEPWYSPDSGVWWDRKPNIGSFNGWPYYHPGDCGFSEWGNPVTPTVTTQEVTDIAPETATGNGNITDLGGSAVTQHGHCWSTSPNPTTADHKTELGAKDTTGAFTSDITGLTPETTYHTRAYATNSWDTAYGADRTFTTKKVSKVPAVRTYGVTNVEPDSAVLIGELTDDGDEACEIAFEWGLTDLYGKDTAWQGRKHTGDAFWQFIASLEPDTTYYFRAQARNSVGTGIGEDMAFETRRREEAEVGVPYSVLNPALLLLMKEEPVFA